MCSQWSSLLVMISIDVFLYLGVNWELVIFVCYYPQSGLLESGDYDFVVYYVCIMEASCMF
jgi:hypothetical protein